MKIVQKKREDNVITYAVTATPADVDTVFNRAHIAFANSMGLQPEQNKTVAQVAKEKMGINDLDSIVRDSATEMFVPMVLDKKNIVPAFMPALLAESRLERGRDFKFQLDVEMKPEYELSSYDPVIIRVQRFEIPEEAVDAEIDMMLNQYTAYLPVKEGAEDRAVKSGDYVKVAIKATEDGKPFESLNADGRTYAVGAGHMPKGFDDEVQGMKVGETKSFQFEAPTFDDDLNETTATVDCTVTILDLLEEQKPELTDEWVKRNFPMFASADEMRKNIRKSIEIRERDGYNAYIRQAVASAWAERFEGKIADEVYEAMMAQLRENIQLDLRQQGKSWDEFVNESGGEQQVTMMLMMQARDVLVQGYALDAIFRHFGLAVTEDDVLEVCRTMNSQVDPRQLHEQIKQNGQGFALRESAERFKANQYALENATIEYMD